MFQVRVIFRAKVGPGTESVRLEDVRHDVPSAFRRLNGDSVLYLSGKKSKEIVWDSRGESPINTKDKFLT